MVQLQYPSLLDQTQATSTSPVTQSSSQIATPTLDASVLYSSVSGGMNSGGAEGIQFSTALEQLAATGNQTILSIQPEQHAISTSSVGVSFADGGQAALHHVNPSSMAFHHQPHELLQQPGSQSATVIIQQPMLDDSTASNQSGTTVTTLLDSQGQFNHHQLLQTQPPQLVTSDVDNLAASNIQHQMVHHVLVDPTSIEPAASGHFHLTGGSGGDGREGQGGDGGVVTSSVMRSGDPSPYSAAAVSIAGGVEFVNTGSLSLHDGLPSSTTTYSS